MQAAASFAERFANPSAGLLQDLSTAGLVDVQLEELEVDYIMPVGGLCHTGGRSVGAFCVAAGTYARFCVCVRAGCRVVRVRVYLRPPEVQQRGCKEQLSALLLGWHLASGSLVPTSQRHQAGKGLRSAPRQGCLKLQPSNSSSCLLIAPLHPH